MPDPVTTAPPGITAADIVLRPDGLGVFPFGSSEASIVTALTEVLGPPSPDAGPPQGFATGALLGCAWYADTVYGFAGLTIGVADRGSGPVFVAWAAYDGIVDSHFSTPEGFRSDGDFAALERTYEGHVTRRGESEPGQLPYVKSTLEVETPNGLLLAGEWGPSPSVTPLTAGVQCTATPTDVAPVGGEPIGLRFRPRPIVIAEGQQQPTEWVALAGCEETPTCIMPVGGYFTGRASIAWALRNVSIASDPIWEVTDAFPIAEGSEVVYPAFSGPLLCTDPIALYDEAFNLLGTLRIGSEGKFVYRDPPASNCTVKGPDY